MPIFKRNSKIAIELYNAVIKAGLHGGNMVVFNKDTVRAHLNGNTAAMSGWDKLVAEGSVVKLDKTWEGKQAYRVGEVLKRGIPDKNVTPTYQATAGSAQAMPVPASPYSAQAYRGGGHHTPSVAYAPVSPMAPSHSQSQGAYAPVSPVARTQMSPTQFAQMSQMPGAPLSPMANVPMSPRAPMSPSAYAPVSPNAYTPMSPNAYTSMSPRAQMSPNAYVQMSPRASMSPTPYPASVADAAAYGGGFQSFSSLAPVSPTMTQRPQFSQFGAAANTAYPVARASR